MALVLWTYNNPRVNLSKLHSINFTFGSQNVKVEQNLSVDISKEENTNYKLWNGSYLLALYLESRESGCFRGKKCLELGSGCGLVGMVAGLLGANVTLTDLPSALHHTKHCLSLNQHLENISNVKTAPYIWGSPTHHNNKNFEEIDFILGSDIVYSADHISDLVCTFKLLFSGQTTAFLSYKERGQGEERFFERLNQEGFVCHHEEVDDEQFKNSDYKIYVIKRIII